MPSNPGPNDDASNGPAGAADRAGVGGDSQSMRKLAGVARPWLVLLLVCAAFSMHPTFRSIFWHQDYLSGIVGQSARNIVLAVGLTFVIVTGGIDLSVGSVLALSGVAMGMALTGVPRFPFWLALLTALPASAALALLAARQAGRTSRTTAVVSFVVFLALLEAGGGALIFKGVAGGVKVEAAILIGLAIGLASGLVNGAVVAWGGVPSFVATLGMMSAARGLTLYATSSQSVSVPFERFRALGSGLPLIVITLIVALCGGLLLLKYRAGRYLLAVGGNEQAALLSGVPVVSTKILAFCLSGLCAAIGGVIITAKFGTANTGAGTGAELEAIAAVVIGGASLSGGQGTMVGAVVGALTITVITNGLVLVGIEPNLQQVILGGVIVLTVFLDQIQRRRK
jgi:ribose/xylose/arabinose/galactoside ABC-type transport system permease subunit